MKIIKCALYKPDRIRLEFATQDTGINISKTIIRDNEIIHEINEVVPKGYGKLDLILYKPMNKNSLPTISTNKTSCLCITNNLRT